MYKILSAGIHSLSEDDCTLYFPLVKAAILQILEQDLAAKQRRDAEKNLEIEIAKTVEKLKRTSD